jgi:ankyrin repeat protein
MRQASSNQQQQQQQHLSLVPHRTPNLHMLLEEGAKGDLRAVQAFLNNGGLPNAVVQSYASGHYVPLLHAVSKQWHDEVADNIGVLCSAGAEVAAVAVLTDEIKITALMAACSMHHSRDWADAAQALLQNGADPYQKTVLECTALHLAARGAAATVCELLLTSTSRCEPDVRCSKGRTPLMEAAMGQHLAAMRLLVRLGADVNAVSKNRTTALYMAARKGHTDAVTFLLDSGANYTIRPYDGLTLLQAVVESGNVELFHALAARGAHVHALGANQLSVLLVAAAEGHTGMAAMLINQYGVDINAASASGQTALMTAVLYDHYSCAELLLANGAAVNSVASAGYTALHWCVNKADNAAMMQLLLTHGADVHKLAASTLGYPVDALTIAVNEKRVNAVRVLLDAGANAARVSPLGFTNLMGAIEHDTTEIAQALLQHGAAATINNKCHKGISAVMLCKNDTVLKFLLDAGADVHVTLHTGETCLHFAAHWGHPVRVICVLIKAGVDVKALNADGQTAADVARAQKHDLIARLLDHYK